MILNLSGKLVRDDAMGLLKSFFRPKESLKEEPAFEILQRPVSLDKPQKTAWVKIRGREVSARELLLRSARGRHIVFSRFYLSHGDPVKTHYAPSLEQAVNWFRGKGLPRDGYGNIYWGSSVVYACRLCQAKKEFRLNISKVEKVVLHINFPEYRDLIGWRVIEVSNDQLGKGIPTRVIRMDKTVPVIEWYFEKNQYLCQRCAQKLAELGRGQEIEDYMLFDAD
jgi:hypothetical protein